MRSTLSLALLIVAGAAQAQLFVGNDQSGTATIYEIDVNTGIASPRYSTSTAAQKVWGMASDNVNNILYWNGGGTLNWAPLADLRAGTAVPTSVSLTFNGSATNFVALAFDAANNRLLGTRNIATEAVYEIDVVTGVATQIYVYPSTFDFGGLDMDDATGRLYGLTDTAPAGSVRGLYEIGLPAGPETFIAGYPGTETDIDGLAIGGGRAYFVSDGPNTTQANFYVFDLASGTQVGTLPSPFTGSGTFSGAAWAAPVPEPATMAALGIGALALLRRRRKQA